MSMAGQRAIFQITIIRRAVSLPVFHEAQARNDPWKTSILAEWAHFGKPVGRNVNGACQYAGRLKLIERRERQVIS